MNRRWSDEHPYRIARPDQVGYTFDQVGSDSAKPVACEPRPPVKGFSEYRDRLEERDLMEADFAARPQRAHADFVWRDGKAVPDNEGSVVHPSDYLYDPMRNTP